MHSHGPGGCGRERRQHLDDEVGGGEGGGRNRLANETALPSNAAHHGLRRVKVLQARDCKGMSSTLTMR